MFFLGVAGSRAFKSVIFFILEMFASVVTVVLDFLCVCVCATSP